MARGRKPVVAAHSEPAPGQSVQDLLPPQLTLETARQIKPNAAEIGACRPWLETEIALVKPRILVCLGATAAQALLGRAFKVTQQRGIFVESRLAPLVTATVHPSSILRAPDADARREEMRAFVSDLKNVARRLASAPTGSSR